MTATRAKTDSNGKSQLLAELSARETDVLRLVAEGKTNREVAEALVISPATVERHMHNIPVKLNAANRTAAASLLKNSEPPAAVAEVLAVLGTVDLEGKSASHSESGANPLDRLARGVFVGRERELERLHAAFDDAFAGRGGLVMLVGEPGIGKTRTAQELGTYARMRGAQVLWGGNHEGSAAPPYWPWVQAGRQWVGTKAETSIAEDMAPARGELVRLFPELRNTPGFVEPEPITYPEMAQFRLFDAVVMFVRAMQRTTPMVIVLDDLHWADKSTLLLLQHLARELSHLRVLLLGTYRDTDLSRTHPLSAALATLNRDPGFQRVVLRGLAKDELAAYIKATANIESKAEVVERIFEETEGNPFFLSEVVNLLTQEGTLGKDSLLDIAVPDGVKEALGRRLDRLSEDANSLLQVAAIMGREFAYDTLNLLSERTEDDLLALVEEGIDARVIEELPRPGRYRFTHALMHETVLGELSTTRRVRLHGQVGEALEEHWGRRADERAPRLAQHFLESSNLTPRHARRAVHYAKLAAEQAEAQTAWDEAAKWYERVLALVTTADDGLGEDEAELLAALGHFQRLNIDFRNGWRNVMRAIDKFSERGDGTRMAEVTIDALQLQPHVSRRNALIEDALSALGERSPRLRAQLLLRRGDPRLVRANALTNGDDETRKQTEARVAEARRLLADSDWPEVMGRLELFDAQWDLREGAFDTARGRFEKARALLARGGAFDTAGLASYFIGTSWLVQGKLDDALAELRRGIAFVEHHRIRYMINNHLAAVAGVHLLRCDFADFEEFAALSGMEWVGVMRAKHLTDRGKPDEARAVCPAPSDLAPVVRVEARGEAIRALVHLDEKYAASAQLPLWFEEWHSVMAGSSGGFAGCAHLGEALTALGTTEQVQSVFDLLAASAQHRFTYGGGNSLDRLRGDYAFHLGLIDDAERWYRLGFEICTRERCPVELGRCHQGLAAVAEKRGDMSSAREHLDAAGELFHKHGARLFLDQVLKKKEILKA